MGDVGPRHEQHPLRTGVPVTAGQATLLASAVLLFLGSIAFQLRRLDSNASDASSDLSIVVAFLLMGGGVLIASIVLLAWEQFGRQRR